ncbi:MAG TPA: hypothetical protein VMV43_10985 [Candidatus Nanopelagicaceae bacterium]|jgi:hypothetical protein|nr:hypothetical protein [Candidatus Nanopelagicaceae bacterium]
MSNNPNSVNLRKDNQEDTRSYSEIENEQKEIIEKDLVPHFLPTYRIKFKFYPIPIVVVIILASILAYLAFFVAGVQVEESYFPEEELGALAVILNGVIFTVIAVVSGFIIVFFIKKLGIGVLKYLFGLTFGFVGFFITIMFLDIIIYLIFIQFPETTFVLKLYFLFTNFYLPMVTAISVFFLIYKYFTSKSIKTKNFIVLYISLLISASMSIVLPFWSTLAILVGISFWDIFAVLYKKGPIKEMIEILSENDNEDEMTKAEIEEKIESGNAVYDTSKLEIGIGDLVFYALLTSSVLLFTNNIIITALTAVAIVIGTGITISRLKKNKILPGLPISIFLGIGAFLLSQLIVTIFFI